MLIIDSANAPGLARGLAREEKKAELRQWVDDQTRHQVYLKEDELAPTNADLQWGQKMSAALFETKLKRLDPTFRCEVNPYNPTKKALYHPFFENGLGLVCAYENDVMPEHSIREVRVEHVRDFSVGETNENPLCRADLPKYEVVPDDSPLGQKIVFDPTATPLGMRKVYTQGREILRGWRTILIRIVEKGLATPTQVENIFGSDNRPQWAHHMGKQALELPW